MKSITGQIRHAMTRTGGLFASFIDTFLKMKQEASGWPEWCDTEEKKQEYITAYAKNEGINLVYKAIEKNPGKRTLAKLLLNSFWEKFGQRHRQNICTAKPSFSVQCWTSLRISQTSI